MRKYIIVLGMALTLPFLAGCWEQFSQGNRGHYEPSETSPGHLESGWHPGDSFFVIRNQDHNALLFLHAWVSGDSEDPDFNVGEWQYQNVAVMALSERPAGSTAAVTDMRLMRRTDHRHYIRATVTERAGEETNHFFRPARPYAFVKGVPIGTLPVRFVHEEDLDNPDTLSVSAEAREVTFEDLAQEVWEARKNSGTEDVYNYMEEDPNHPEHHPTHALSNGTCPTDANHYLNEVYLGYEETGGQSLIGVASHTYTAHFCPSHKRYWVREVWSAANYTFHLWYGGQDGFFPGKF